MVTLLTLQQQRQSWETKCSDLLPIHALSECDTVSYPYGKVKVSAVNVMLL